MKSFHLSILSLSLAISLLSPWIQNASAAETHSIREVAVEINGAKFWFPSTIHAKKGDSIKITLVNQIPGKKNNIHGFKIPAFNIEELVEPGKDKNVEFVANKAGIFPVLCHLHPTHIGGQIVISE